MYDIMDINLLRNNFTIISFDHLFYHNVYLTIRVLRLFDHLCYILTIYIILFFDNSCIETF